MRAEKIQQSGFGSFAKFKTELHRVLAYLGSPPSWCPRLRTAKLAEGFFRHLSRFPSSLDAAHNEKVSGCFMLACEQPHA